MLAQLNVEELIRRTKRYEFDDGLRDLQMAVAWVGMGVVSWFVFELPGVWLPFFIRLADVAGGWARWTSMLLVFLPALAAIGMLALTTYARRRWLWRASGTVKPLRRPTPRRVAVIATAVWLLSVLLSIELRRRGLVGDQFVLRMLVVAAGWATGYWLVALGRHIAMPRYVWLGVVGGLASTPVLFLSLTFGQTWLVFGLGWGLILSVSGGLALRRRLSSLRGVGDDG
jgi:hypothetical protein